MDRGGGENPNRQVRGDGSGRFAGEDADSGEEVQADCLSREFGAPRARSRCVPLAVELEGRFDEGAEHAAPVFACEAEDQEA